MVTVSLLIPLGNRKNPLFIRSVLSRVKDIWLYLEFLVGFPNSPLKIRDTVTTIDGNNRAGKSRDVYIFRCHDTCDNNFVYADFIMDVKINCRIWTKYSFLRKSNKSELYI